MVSYRSMAHAKSEPKKKRQRLMVEMASGRLKWAVADVQGSSSTLAALGVINLSDTAAEELYALCKKYKIGPTDVTACVQRKQVTVRILELPSVDPDEIRKIIDLQAVKQTPYAPDEIVFDYYVLKSCREGYSSVLVMIVHREVLNAQLVILHKAGLRPGVITLATEAAAFRVKGQLGIGEEEVFAVIDVDGSDSDFYVCQGGRVFFTQNLSVGSEKLATDPGEAATRLVDELARSYQIYRSEEIAKEPARLILAGAAQELVSAAAKITAATNIPVDEQPLPAGTEGFFTDASVENAAAWNKSLSFNAVMGLSMRTAKPPVNFVPQEILIKASLVEKSRNLFVTGILSFSIFLTLLAWFMARYFDKVNYLHWLEQKSQATASSADLVALHRAHIKDVLYMHQASGRFFEEIQHIIRSVPNDIYLTEMNWTRDNRLVLQGRAETMTGAFNFVNSIKANSDFQSVDTKRLNKRIVDNKEVVDFEIESFIIRERPRV